MKNRALEPETTWKRAETGLCRALLTLENVEEVRAFLRDLCTPSELEALVDRWNVVPYVLEGTPYREIHERTAVSITTIGRVARFINQGYGGYLAATAHNSKRGKSKTKRSHKTAKRAKGQSA
jgi:TrpR-related protein YerC/YecD